MLQASRLRLRIWVGRRGDSGAPEVVDSEPVSKLGYRKKLHQLLSLEQLDDSFRPHFKSHSRRATTTRQLSVTMNQPTVMIVLESDRHTIATRAVFHAVLASSVTGTAGEAQGERWSRRSHKVDITTAQ